MVKRKRNVLSLETKIEIIKRLEKQESQASIAKHYDIGTSTVSDLWKNKDEILKYVSQLDSIEGVKKRKVLKPAQLKLLEDALFMWFVQKRSKGDPITGPLLCEKALDFNEKLGGPSDFKASTGYLRNFKARHGIRLLNIQGEILSGDSLAAEEFKQKFSALRTTENLSLDDIYNVDESGLLWRSLPRKSLASRREATAPGFKSSKERVTILVGGNASGTHPLPLLMIGKSANPRCFKNKRLPLKYTHQKSAWMSGEIFIDWFTNQFIPTVTKFRNDRNLTGKVLLVLDNAPTHPAEEVLNEINKNFKVIFLPPNCTALIQPMDQGVIEKLKRLYRKQLLRRLLAADDEENMISFSKKINLLDCCYMVADAWSQITRENLSRAWNKILGNQDTVDEDLTLQEIVRLFEELPGFDECDLEDATEWLSSDNDPGYQILTDNEILLAVQTIDEEREEEGEPEEVSKPTHQQALSAAETLMQWFEHEPNFRPTDMLLLRRLRDQAAERRSSNLVQKKIYNYFFV